MIVALLALGVVLGLLLAWAVVVVVRRRSARAHNRNPEVAYAEQKVRDAGHRRNFWGRLP